MKINKNSPTLYVNSNYRPEIDGLRAFALAAVIINHFNESLLPSGYLGVDIFFVISGFVITSSLANRTSTSFLAFLTGFYVRRIKRLVPALVAFVIPTGFIISKLVVDPTDELNLGVSSLFGISNIVLYRSRTDYFAESTDLNPFTHTWSLGVEEQFYLVFPLLIWISGFARHHTNSTRNLLYVILTLSAASVISFVYLYQFNQPAAYFMMFPRFWEMSAGCILFIVLQNGSKFKDFVDRLPPFLVIASMVGVMYLPTSHAVLATIITILLSVLIVACLQEGSLAYKLFSNKLIVYIGLISYSLYLWHWGILCISRWTIGIHWWSAPFQLALMIIIASLSYKWLETPIRLKTFSNPISPYLSGAGSIAFASIFLVSLRSGFVQALNNYTFKRDPIYNGLSVKNCEIAYPHSAESEKGISLSKECGASPFVDRPTVYALGDSHVHQYFEPLASLLRANKFNYVFVWGGACLFPSPIIVNGFDTCFNRQKTVEVSLINNLRKNDIVLIANALSVRFPPGKQLETYQTTNGNYLDTNSAAQYYVKNIDQLSRKIKSKGAKLVFYKNLPDFPGLSNGELCRVTWYRPEWALLNTCFVSLNIHQSNLDKHFKSLFLLKNNKNSFIWNPIENTLSCKKGICTGSDYSDTNHISKEYASFHLREFFRKNMQIFRSP